MDLSLARRAAPDVSDLARLRSLADRQAAEIRELFSTVRKMKDRCERAERAARMASPESLRWGDLNAVVQRLGDPPPESLCSLLDTIAVTIDAALSASRLAFCPPELVGVLERASGMAAQLYYDIRTPEQQATDYHDSRRELDDDARRAGL